jgi:hypothetical protein
MGFDSYANSDEEPPRHSARHSDTEAAQEQPPPAPVVQESEPGAADHEPDTSDLKPEEPPAPKRWQHCSDDSDDDVWQKRKKVK